MPHGALPSIDGRCGKDHNWMYFHRSYNLSPIDSYIPIYPYKLTHKSHFGYFLFNPRISTSFSLKISWHPESISVYLM